MIAPRRQPPGARGRIGVIQPAPGVMLEHEWPRWLPADVLFPVARIAMTGADAAGYAALAAAAPQAARDLASAGCDCVAYACAIGSLYAGVEAETALAQALTAASGRPAISLAAASIDALRAVGATRITILTPYAPATNGWVGDYAHAQGLAVDAFLPTPVGIVEIGDLHASEIAALSIAAMAARPDADALWIPCTAIRTLDAIATIEAACGRPVVSGSQALLWRALQAIGAGDPPRGAGSLFAVS